MNTQGGCVLPQCVWTVQGSLEGEEKLHRTERENTNIPAHINIHTHTHTHTHTHSHTHTRVDTFYMAHLRAASHKDKLG